jgi:oxysterol-binding protein-related protein 8
LFDAKKAKIQPKIVAPEDQQEPNESRRLWANLTAALKVNNQDVATTEKSKVEDAQRSRTKARGEVGEAHVPRYFESDGKGGFDIKLKK